MKYLLCLLCVAFLGCEFSGTQRGKWLVSGQRIETAFSGKGCSVTFFGTKNTEIDNLPTYEVLKLFVLDDRGLGPDMIGEVEHIGIRSAIRSIGNQQLVWDRQTDTVLIGEAKFDVNDGRMFLLQCHEGVVFKIQQFSNEMEMLSLIEKE